MKKFLIATVALSALLIGTAHAECQGMPRLPDIGNHMKHYAPNGLDSQGCVVTPPPYTPKLSAEGWPTDWTTSQGEYRRIIQPTIGYGINRTPNREFYVGEVVVLWWGWADDIKRDGNVVARVGRNGSEHYYFKVEALGPVIHCQEKQVLLHIEIRCDDE